MRSRLLLALTICTLLGLYGTSAAYAVEHRASQPIERIAGDEGGPIGPTAGSAGPPAHAVSEISSTVSFEFVAGDQTLPAGTYLVERNPSGIGPIELRSVKGDYHVTLPVITRLAKDSPEKRAPYASLIFDQVGDQKYLSEVWMANEDGYLVRATAEEHSHVAVTVKPSSPTS